MSKTVGDDRRQQARAGAILDRQAFYLDAEDIYQGNVRLG